MNVKRTERTEWESHKLGYDLCGEFKMDTHPHDFKVDCELVTIHTQLARTYFIK